MKKRFVIGLLPAIVLLFIILFLVQNKEKKPFYLEKQYYEESSMTEIQMSELNDIIGKKESFLVFIYQPMCITSSNFEGVLNDFLKDYSLHIYKIAFSTIKETTIGKLVKYYPSFAIYRKGEIVAFLKSDKEEDVSSYTSKEGFYKWLTKYVYLKNVHS